MGNGNGRAAVVKPNEQYIGRTFRHLHRLRITGRRVLVRFAELAFEFRIRLRQLVLPSKFQELYLRDDDD